MPRKTEGVAVPPIGRILQEGPGPAPSLSFCHSSTDGSVGYYGPLSRPLSLLHGILCGDHETPRDTCPPPCHVSTPAHHAFSLRCICSPISRHPATSTSRIPRTVWDWSLPPPERTMGSGAGLLPFPLRPPHDTNVNANGRPPSLFYLS